MKYLSYIGLGVCTLWVFACGQVSEVPFEESIQRGPSAEDPRQHEPKKEIEEETFYSVRDPIPYLENIQILGRVQFQCERHSLSNQCITKLSDIRSKDIQVMEDHISFQKPGLYLVEEDHLPKLIRVASQQNNAVLDFELHAFKDSFYNTLYHFDLVFFEDLKDKVLDVSWQVDGGRFHFYDEDLSYLKRTRPIQKTILFLEKKVYEISVTLRFNEKEVLTKKISLDLIKGFDEDSDQDYRLKAFYKDSENTIQLLSDLDLEQSKKYHWQLGRLEKVYCDESIRYLETAADVEKICNRSYVRKLTKGIDYDLQNSSFKEALLILKGPGNYLINLEVTNAQNELLHKLSQKLRHE